MATHPPMEVGSVPVNLLVWSLSIWRVLIFCIASFSVPVSKFSKTLNSASFCKKKIVSGILPHSLLVPKSIFLSSVVCPKTLGIEPESWLAPKSNDSSLYSFPIYSGKNPVKRLSCIDISTRLAACHKLLGNDPFIWFEPKFKFFNLGIFPIDEGSVPVIKFLPSCKMATSISDISSGIVPLRLLFSTGQPEKKIKKNVQDSYQCYCNNNFQADRKTNVS